MSSPLKVIVLGSGNSGSGAVYDYLGGREDFEKPFRQEFRLVSDPGGLVDLYDAVCTGFHVNRASAAIEAFRDLCERCGRTKKVYPRGLNYSRFIDSYQEKVDRYIDRITAVTHKGMPFCEQSRLPAWRSFLFERRRGKAEQKGGKYQIGTMRLPVGEKRFLEETRAFLDGLLFDESNGPDEGRRHVTLDQGGSFWAPASSTRFYGPGRKAVVVSRDPRSVFSSFRTKGQAYPGYDVNLFCDWFRAMSAHIDKAEWEDEHVVHVRFEDFTQNYSEEKARLDRALGIPVEVESEAPGSNSAGNVHKYKNRLSKEEISTIERKLEEFLHF